MTTKKLLKKCQARGAWNVAEESRKAQKEPNFKEKST